VINGKIITDIDLIRRLKRIGARKRWLSWCSWKIQSASVSVSSRRGDGLVTEFGPDARPFATGSLRL